MVKARSILSCIQSTLEVDSNEIFDTNTSGQENNCVRQPAFLSQQESQIKRHTLAIRLPIPFLAFSNDSYKFNYLMRFLKWSRRIPVIKNEALTRHY